MNYLKLSNPPTPEELEKAQKIIFKSQVRAIYGKIFKSTFELLNKEVDPSIINVYLNGNGGK